MAVKPKQKKKIPATVVSDKNGTVADSSPTETTLTSVADEPSSQVDNNNQLAENGAETNQVDEAKSASEADAVSENTHPNCKLEKEQVVKAVDVAFRAFKASKLKVSNGNLFDEEPDIVSLSVSSIKVNDARPKPILATLPNPVYSKESDVCLIVKDLEKGWKVDHEPTAQHYKELLQSQDISYINEIMPLRQLRVEYKPFEARGKLAKRFDIMLVDKEICHFVPRYLGKAFYQNGKLPIPVDMKSNNLAKELETALRKCTMSMTNNGTTSSIRVGLSNFEEEQLVENIMAVYDTLCKKFPGKFANIRSMNLRFGREEWTVPIYISYASRESVILPPTPKDTAPLIDDLTTLPPGQKVAVYKSGQVVVIKDENYQRTPLDDAMEEDKGKKSKPAKKQKKKSDVEEDEDDLSESEGGEGDLYDVDGDEDESEAEEEKTKAPEQKAAPKQKGASKQKAVPKTADDDDSSDDGNALEDEYMDELALLEEETVTKPTKEGDIEDEPPSKKPKPAKKVVKAKAAKKQKVK